MNPNVATPNPDDQGQGSSMVADHWVERLFELTMVFVVGVSLIGLCAALLGVFHAPQVLIAALLVVGLYAYRTRASNGLPGPAPRWRHVLLLLAVALFFRVPAYHYVMGGQDEGVYVNVAHHIEYTGEIYIRDKLKAQLRNTPYLGGYLEDNHVGGSYLAGVYQRGPGNNKLEFQFYHVFPVWVASFDGVFGPGNGICALTFLALFSILLFYRLTLLLTGSYKAALSAGGLLALNPLHAFFSKFPVTEVPTLCFALAGFTLLAGYWSASNEQRRASWLVLSVLAFLCVFTTRISGFMYIPFFIGMAWVALLFDRDVQRFGRMQRWTLGVVVAYLVSVVYGLIWSRAYAHDIYRLSFEPLLGGHWKLLLPLIGLFILSAWAILAVVRRRWDRRLGNWFGRINPLLDRGPIAIVSVALLLGLVRIYRFGWTGQYLHTSLDTRWHLAETGWKAASATSLWTLIVFLGPLLVVLLFVLIARKCNDPRLGFLRWFLAGFFAYAMLLQWLVPYSPYYARYMLSEVVPYTLLLIVYTWSTLRPRVTRASVSLAMILSAVYAAGLSVAQIGKDENDGAYSALARLTAKVDPSDLILLYAPPDSSVNQSEVKTPLLYTFHLNVVTVGSAALANPGYLAKLDAMYDDVFLITTRTHAPAGFEHEDDTRFAVKSFEWNHSFPHKLLTARNVLLYLYWLKRVPPLPGSVVGFASRELGEDWLQSGWSTPEAWGVWSLGRQAALSIDPRYLSKSTDPLILKLHVNTFVNAAHPMQRIGVSVDGQQVAEYTARYPRPQLEMVIPLGRHAAGDSERFDVGFSLPDAVSPQSLGLSNDARDLALGLLDAQVIPASGMATQPAASTTSGGP